jgi:hypothetical protein
MGGVVLDGFDTRGQGGQSAGERAVADLQLDDVFSLGLETPGHGQNIEGGFGREPACERAQSNRHRRGILKYGYCFAAIACANGRTTPGTIWVSTRSWQIAR